MGEVIIMNRISIIQTIGAIIFRIAREANVELNNCLIGNASMIPWSLID